jgi:hypothetical protein
MALELTLLTRRAGEAGGMEALLEQFVYQSIERKLAAGQKTYVVSAVARVLRVSERQLMDLVEGKNDPQPATTSPAAVASSLAVPIIALVLCLFGATAASAAHPLGSPQRWEPREVTPTIDPPTFKARPAQGDVLAPADLPIELRPVGVNYAPIYARSQPPPVRRAWFAPFRFRCR